MVGYMDRLAQQIGHNTYAEYLASDYWKRFSGQVRQASCFCCGRKRHLQVHHITYERLGCERVADCVTVCGKCHVAIHEIARNGTPLAQAHLVRGRRVSKANFQSTGAVGKRKKNRHKKHTNRKKVKPLTWVQWFDLPHHPAEISRGNLRQWLTSKGLLDGEEPTDLAYHLFFTSLIDDKPLWCRQTYYKTRKADKQARRQQARHEHYMQPAR